LQQPGLYGLLVKAAGHTFNKKPFTREQLRSATVWVDQPVPPRSDGKLCCK